MKIPTFYIVIAIAAFFILSRLKKVPATDPNANPTWVFDGTSANPTWSF